jgi:hypothetical protein
LTGSASRKPHLIGGDKGRNKKTDGFLAGKPRPVGGLLPKRPSAQVSLILRRSTYQQVRLTAWEFRGPCIWAFLNSLQKETFSTGRLMSAVDIPD